MAEIEMKQVVVVECPALECPAPDRVVRDGFVHGRQRYECKACGNNFFAEGKPLRKQFTAQQIGDAVDSYYSGMSYKQVAEGLEDTYDLPEPAKSTVFAWVKGYTRLAQRFLDGEVGMDGTERTATGQRVQADVGEHWVADELFLRVGGNQLYCWNVMDAETRYILAAHLSVRRGTNDAIKVFEKALANAERPPKSITTDGLGSYQDAARAVFPKAEHIVSEGVYEETNNNLSERLQGSFRQRTKTQRGLEQRLTGQEYLDGWVIDYNFFKDHHALHGRAPAEVAGVTQQVPWREWEDIVRMGGEVAEPRIKSSVATPKKPGPKPRDRRVAGIQAEIARYLADKADRETVAKAKERRRKNGAPMVAPYWKRRGERGVAGGRGRGQAEMRQKRK